MAETSSTGGIAHADAVIAPPKIFISYRHKDTGAHALLLFDRLAKRFGAKNVFLDVEALKPGMDWRKAIKASANACGVLIVLMGQQWLSILRSSAQRNVLEPVDDVARDELELALTNRQNIDVVPVLVDDAIMPPPHQLPRSVRALSDRQAEQLRLGSYEVDVERLIDRLERIATESATRDEQTSRKEPKREANLPRPPIVAGLHAGHYERVAKLLLGAGHVVVLLGSGVNADCGELPDSERLAAKLAHRFAYESESNRLNLAQVAEYVYLTSGEPDLYLTLKESLSIECHPGRIHGFLAGLPRRLEALGRNRSHQLIVTTNYDTALEQAFHDASEPYDLAVYMASGPDAGKFVHLPWKDSPRVAAPPNGYHAFPIGDDRELTRTLIVKIHGAVDGRESGYDWQDNYVITEDNYIDYLSGSAIEELVPFQILLQLRSSHCLFLGYDIRDWNLRVFMKRIWGARVRASSWAIQEQPDDFERELWRDCHVELLAEPLNNYMDALSASLDSEK